MLQHVFTGKWDCKMPCFPTRFQKNISKNINDNDFLKDCSKDTISFHSIENSTCRDDENNEDYEETHEPRDFTSTHFDDPI